MIFSVLKIANLSLYWLQIKIFMSLFFYLFTFEINFWHWKFVTADVTAVFVNNQHGIKQRGQDFDKKFVFEGVHSKEVDRRISWEKLVLISCSKSCGTQAQLTGGQQRQTTQCPHWRKRKASFWEVPAVCHWHCSADCQVKWPRSWEHLFVRKKNKVSGILRELLKQKLSVLRASNTVCVSQLLCTAPLETFQMQVLTDNLGYRRRMNTRLPWYLSDSPMGLRLVLLTQY